MAATNVLCHLLLVRFYNPCLTFIQVGSSPPRNTQKCVSMVILHPVKSTMKLIIVLLVVSLTILKFLITFGNATFAVRYVNCSGVQERHL